jgi:type I restriction enzyme R subunit
VNPGKFTEDQLVEQPAIELFAELGWSTVNALHEKLGADGTLGRDNQGEVILLRHLRPALERLNPALPQLAIEQTIAELTKDRSAMDPVRANRELYDLVKDGVEVEVRRDDGGKEPERVRVIDWGDPAANDFLLVSQFWVVGDMYKRRADLVGFVNGLPLVLIELKASHKKLEHAYHDNLTDYRVTIPRVFWPNGLIILSNGRESKVGTVSSGWEHFAEWKKVDDETEPGVVSLETMLRGTCEPARLLDLVESFTVFQERPRGLVKLLGRNHQYLGVNNAIRRLGEIRDAPEQERGRLGVFWHTQGSGKTLSMLFFSQKVLRKLPGNWTFVIVTDRKDLDDQVYEQFTDAGVLTEATSRRPAATTCARYWVKITATCSRSSTSSGPSGARPTRSSRSAPTSWS